MVRKNRLFNIGLIGLYGIALLMISSCDPKSNNSRIDDEGNNNHHDGSSQLSFGASDSLERPEYNSASWRESIADSCKAFFDGCNNCRRVPSGEAACTRKACAVYQQPKCLDDEIDVSVDDGGANEETFKVVNYICEEGNTFRVFYGEYRVDDQRVRLKPEQIMLSDQQTHTTSSLTRAPSPSGEKYQAKDLEFWSVGEEATLSVNAQMLYSNCMVDSQTGIRSGQIAD